MTFPSIFNQQKRIGLPSLISKFDDMFSSFDDMFSSPLLNYPPLYNNLIQSDYNIETIDEKNKVILYEMPGVNKDDLSLTFKEDEGLITISAESKDEKKSYYCRGVKKQRIERTWRIPTTFKVKDASLEDGLLKIFIEDHTPEEKKPIPIPIK